MKDVAGTLRLDLSQYRELEAFSQFGSDLDKSTQQKLARGERIVEILKQNQYSPMPVEEQVIIIYTVTNGYLDDLPVDNLQRFEEEYLNFVDSNYVEVKEEIVESGKLSDELKEKLDEMVKEFKEMFQVQKNTIVDLDTDESDDAGETAAESSDSNESDTEAEEAEVK
jgi:F-type H+-transporting ATPase subunit alpha